MDITTALTIGISTSTLSTLELYVLLEVTSRSFSFDPTKRHYDAINDT